GWSLAVRPISARNSVTSFVFAENARACAFSGSSGEKRWSDSFSVAPQPAALEPIAFGEAQQFEDANPARDGLQAGTLVQTERASRVFNEVGFREEPWEKKSRAARANQERSCARSMRARAYSTNFPYSTPEGQAVSQARQSRHFAT